MLNEILECQEYWSMKDSNINTLCLKNGKKCGAICHKACAQRLYASTLFDSKEYLRGIGRALEIITRDAIFKKSSTNKEKVVKNIIDEWFSTCLNEDYINTLLENDSKIEMSKSYIKSFKESFYKSTFANNKNLSNDINKLRYDTVLATAINKGPLKTYYLVSKDKVDWKNIIKIDRNGKEQKTTKLNQDFILKLTSAFLLEQKYSLNTFSSQLCRAITLIDVVNWSEVSRDNSIYLFQDTYDKIYTREYINESKNPVKFRFNKEWIENFYLEDVTDDAHKKHWEDSTTHDYYIDCGARKPLKHISNH